MNWSRILWRSAGGFDRMVARSLPKDGTEFLFVCLIAICFVIYQLSTGPDEDAFLERARKAPSVAGWSDERLLKVGNRACIWFSGKYDSGDVADQAEAMAGGDSVAEGDVPVIQAAAIAELCDEPELVVE